MESASIDSHTRLGVLGRLLRKVEAVNVLESVVPVDQATDVIGF